MRIAYLLFAYKNPALISRMVKQLSGSESAFFVHIDEKVNLEPFARLNAENVHFTPKRVRVDWAEFSGVEAILLLISQALAAKPACDYLFLLSGSEYPLKGRRYIHNYLETNAGAEFISAVKMPNAEAGKPISRINTIRFPSSRPLSRLTFKLLGRVGLATRDFREYLGELEPYGGNTWWTLTRSACEYVVEFSKRNPYLARYFERVFAPEEYFIHTILGNSPFKSKLRRNLFFEDWSALGGHPAMIRDKHLDLFERDRTVYANDAYGRGEALFARKFSDDNLAMIDRLDARIMEERN
jgi:hypothetical protein